MFNTDLAPVQVMFLKAPKKIGIDDVFSIILRDLTLRRILNVDKINCFPNDRSRKTQKYFMLVRGENYEGYEPKEFEKGFILPFLERNQVQTKTLTNFILRKYSTPSGFIDDKIFQPLHNEHYISSIPIVKTFGYYKVSNKGMEIVSELNEFIAGQEEKLTGLIDGDKGEFINALEETGVYIFHFEKNNPVLYKNLISMVKRVYVGKPFGPQLDLRHFMQAINLDLSYFVEH
ncbi:MAG: hypothetical protein PF517_08890 [Salinivirgaceae bacterium]|jgi:hypothetical protein|nr:hypothetical protein [Salinivirgaceae bacterium]